MAGNSTNRPSSRHLQDTRTESDPNIPLDLDIAVAEAAAGSSSPCTRPQAVTAVPLDRPHCFVEAFPAPFRVRRQRREARCTPEHAGPSGPLSSAIEIAIQRGLRPQLKEDLVQVPNESATVDAKVRLFAALEEGDFSIVMRVASRRCCQCCDNKQESHNDFHHRVVLHLSPFDLFGFSLQISRS